MKKMEIYEEIEDPILKCQFEIVSEELQKKEVEIDELRRLILTLKNKHSAQINRIKQDRF